MSTRLYHDTVSLMTLLLLLVIAGDVTSTQSRHEHSLLPGDGELAQQDQPMVSHTQREHAAAAAVITMIQL